MRARYWIRDWARHDRLSLWPGLALWSASWFSVTKTALRHALTVQILECFSAIQIWFSWRAGFPTFVDPEPLIGITTDKTFHRFGKPRRVEFHVLMSIAGADQFNWRITVKEVTPALLIPY